LQTVGAERKDGLVTDGYTGTEERRASP
jgi:hypothetical protein